MIGVELGGALKNPLAIGAGPPLDHLLSNFSSGMLEGMSMGINTISAYVTRSSMELMELCKAMGGEPQTISGLSGIGTVSLHLVTSFPQAISCSLPSETCQEIELLERNWLS
jgi:glycerol-3-phosphate dehydrogenase